MEKINDLFDVQIAKTIDAYPSIFSKDDVITLLSSLRTESLHAIHEMLPQSNPYLIDEEKFQEFNAAVRNKLDNWLNNNQSDTIDYDSVEFRIDYDNRIQVENIDLNIDSITEELDDILLTEWQLVYGDLKTDE
jgi:hypothetical protein